MVLHLGKSLTCMTFLRVDTFALTQSLQAYLYLCMLTHFDKQKTIYCGNFLATCASLHHSQIVIMGATLLELMVKLYQMCTVAYIQGVGQLILWLILPHSPLYIDRDIQIYLQIDKDINKMLEYEQFVLGELYAFLGLAHWYIESNHINVWLNITSLTKIMLCFFNLKCSLGFYVSLLVV